MDRLASRYTAMEDGMSETGRERGSATILPLPVTADGVAWCWDGLDSLLGVSGGAGWNHESAGMGAMVSLDMFVQFER